MEPGLEATEYFRPPQLVYPFGAHVAVVEVDRDTGRVTLRDFISVDDCGVRVSPLLVDGQVHGGIAQGVAQSLLEEVVYGADGQLVTGTLMDYAVPRAGGPAVLRDGPDRHARRRSTRWARRASARPRPSARRPRWSTRWWTR